MAELQEEGTAGGVVDACESELLTHRPIVATSGYWDGIADNASDWAKAIGVCRFWQTAQNNLDEWQREYRRVSGGTLLASTNLPQFQSKSAARIREKVLFDIRQANDRPKRIEEIFDSAIPVPRLDDLVRTRIECEFLDGVSFLAQKLNDLASSNGCTPYLAAKGNIRGYFAQHLTFRSPVHFQWGGGAQSYDVTCEVQLATTMATRMWQESHAVYEVTRVEEDKPEDWQWSPHDPKFLSRQLGHMIHLADGLLCLLRDSAGRSKGKDGK